MPNEKKTPQGRFKVDYTMSIRIVRTVMINSYVGLFVKAVSIDELYLERYVVVEMSVLVYHRCLYTRDPYTRRDCIL